MTAGSIACVVSAPWNYARNMKYATQPGKTPPTTRESIHRLFSRAMTRERPFLYLQQRLRVGWVSLQFP